MAGFSFGMGLDSRIKSDYDAQGAKRLVNHPKSHHHPLNAPGPSSRGLL